MSTPKQRSRRDVLRTAEGLGLAGLGGLAGLTSLAGCMGGGRRDDETGGDGDASGGESPGGGTATGGDLRGPITIFHAGSLAPPFTAAEETFESKYGVQVNREARGSVGSTKKITEQGRSADVLAVSDYRLLPDMVLPEYGSWYAIFATNAMTIAYTGDSAGADEIGPDDWWEVLARDDVTFGHSDPAVDPNGYRSVMSMELGAIPFEGSTLYDEATADALVEKALVPAATETDLIAQLHSGALDYAFNYQSAGASYDVETVDLQESVDLSMATDRYAEHYAKVTIEAGGHTFTGAPIAYGITVPSVARHPLTGAAWVEFMVTEPGQQALRESGFEAVSPAVVPEAHSDTVPDRVAAHATTKSSLGPLSL